MKKLLKKFNGKQAGFTLVELLVVIAIIGILAAIIVPNVTKYIGSGQGAANQAEQKIVQNAVYAALASAHRDNCTATGTVSKTQDFDVTGAAVDHTAKTAVWAYLTMNAAGTEVELNQTYDVALNGLVTVH
jgi:type IV pilus assembly protein PilA